MRKKWRRAVAVFTAVVMVAVSDLPGSFQSLSAEAAAVTEIKENQVDSLYSKYFVGKTYDRVSVHDPSIVVGYYEGTYTSTSQVYGEQNAAKNRKEIYFVFGSHMAWAYSLDLKNWKTFENNINKGYAKIFESQGNWSKRGDSVYNISGNLWAPDVFWDAAYDNGDGTKGAWLMYMSINGCSWNSSISLLKSTTLNGDWTYVDTIIYSGFTASGTYDYSATNYKEVTGDTSLPDRYVTTAYTCKDGETRCAATTWDNHYGAHAIDPCIIEDGDKLWMTYGSWSGGIWMIEMDKTTGLRKTGFKPNHQANVSDPYMGYMLAGGPGASGEASYIQKIGDKYYLFISYGGLVATGGYNMRVFAADTITGPYKDLQGHDARKAITSGAGTVDGTVGNRLMGYYKWDFMDVGFTAEGHNSAFVDDDGKAYVVYHTRFNDGTEEHQLRVHQLFQAKNGGLVTAPFEYSGETLAQTAYPQGDVTGEYRVVKMQSSASDHANLKCATEQRIQLNADGSVTGDYAGTWQQDSDGPYVTLVSGGVTYQGVFLRQNIEETACETMCLTLIGNNDISLWGYQNFSGEAAIVRAVKKMSTSIGNLTYFDLDLPTDVMDGVDVSWTSSHPDIIAVDGTVTPPDQDTVVTLTATLQSGGYLYSKSFQTTVLANLNQGDIETGLKAFYNFDAGMVNVKNTSQIGELLAQTNGKKPERIYDAERGSNVLHQEFGFTGDNNSSLTTSYARYSNPLQGETLSGATISLWINCVGQVDVWDAIWSFFDEDTTDSISGRLYLTPNMYLGYNGTENNSNSWFDLNHANTPTNVIAKDSWKHITVTIEDNAVGIYIDGILAYTFDQRAAYAQGGDSPRTRPLKLISSAANFYTGYGSWWGSAPLYMDNICIYDRALSEREVFKLYGQDVLEVRESQTADMRGCYYYNDYNATKAAGDVWSSENASGYLSLETDTQGSHQGYIKFAPERENSRSAYTGFTGMGILPDRYTVEFDAQLTAGNNQQSQLALSTGAYSKGNASVSKDDYIWALETLNSTEWSVSNGDKVTIPKDSWVHIRTEISQSDKAAKLIIVGDNVSYEGILTDLTKTQVQGLFWLSGRYWGTGCFDNMRIYAYEIAFDANGGTGVMENQAFMMDTAARLRKNMFEREGYIFGGWAVSPDSDAVYADRKKILNLTADGGTVTLYAKWLDPSATPLPTETPDPTVAPTETPTQKPTEAPTVNPTQKPTAAPTETTTQKPTVAPTETPTQKPTEAPTENPTQKPTAVPTETTTQIPTVAPTENPTQEPTGTPTENPTPEPTGDPTQIPTVAPTENPTQEPTGTPTGTPTQEPTGTPTGTPTQEPTGTPTQEPTGTPTQEPTGTPTGTPTQEPTGTPTENPTQEPTGTPTENPTQGPTGTPTGTPTQRPTGTPTPPASTIPSVRPSETPSHDTDLSIKVGQIYEKNREEYRVTGIDEGKKTVSLSEAKNKSIKKLTIASVKTIGSQTFEITAIEKKAFANCKKLKKVVIGKNIRSIGSKAFYKCKKLRKITIKSKKLVKIGKKAFKGISKKVVIKVPASMKKKYKKLLKKKGLSSRARIIK